MKWILGILFCILSLNHTKLSANVYLSVNECDSRLLDSSLGDKKATNTFLNSIVKPNSTVTNSTSNNKYPQKSKKKNKKGVKPVYYCLPVNSVLFSVNVDGDQIFTKKDSETSFCYSGNGKRGPPVY